MAAPQPAEQVIGFDPFYRLGRAEVEGVHRFYVHVIEPQNLHVPRQKSRRFDWLRADSEFRYAKKHTTESDQDYLRRMFLTGDIWTDRSKLVVLKGVIGLEFGVQDSTSSQTQKKVCFWGYNSDCVEGPSGIVNVVSAIVPVRTQSDTVVYQRCELRKELTTTGMGQLPRPYKVVFHENRP